MKGFAWLHSLTRGRIGDGLGRYLLFFSPPFKVARKVGHTAVEPWESR